MEKKFDTPPPKLNNKDLAHPINDKKYTSINKSKLPSSESLKDVVDGVLPLWNKTILNNIKNNKKFLLLP